MRVEFDLALADVGLDALEPLEKIVIPRDAAKLAVGDGFEPHVLLSADHGFDLAIFDLNQRLAEMSPRARFFRASLSVAVRNRLPT